MKVLIIGGAGSIGKRYQAILRSLNINHAIYDPVVSTKQSDKTDSTHIIIASPTDTHTSWLDALAPTGKPILCEKPICKSSEQAQEYLVYDNVRMVCNYQFLPLVESNNQTTVDYYHTGNDGLLWDCIQIIALARGPIYLANESPQRILIINGQSFSYDEIERSYIHMIRTWLDKPKYLWNMQFALDAIKKVEYVREHAKYEKGAYWFTMPNPLEEIPKQDHG